MPQVTFELPENLAAQLTAMPESERNEWAAEVLHEAFYDNETFVPPSTELTEADHESIRRGLADLDAGRVVDSDTFFKALYEKVGLPAPPPFAEAVEKERAKIRAARSENYLPK